MTNNIKDAGGEETMLALQCTRTVKSAGLVDADDIQRQSFPDAYVAAVDNLLLCYIGDVGDVRRTNHLTSLVRDHGLTLGPVYVSELQQRGNGCQINLPAPVVKYAGHRKGMPTKFHLRDGLMVIYEKDRRVDLANTALDEWADPE